MKHFLVHLLFTLICSTTFAQAVSWELSAEPGNQASNPASFESTNFANCSLSRGAGISASAGAGSINSSGWFSGSAATTLSDAIAGNDYYEFNINTINCNFFNPTTIKIVLRSSATGPNTATLRCSSDGFSGDIGTVTVGTSSASFTFSETVSPNSQSITYRIYGYGGAAGGGTPAAGGTMRIGSSVVASDNDIEVFATQTLAQVNSVSNLSVNDGASVAAIVFSSNVPGATINWSRTAESIGLSATSGTGSVPAFTANNNSGAVVTSTFTVNATVGNCTSPDMVFTISVNPPPCTITVDFLGNPGACNDNGTPNDPSDDFFTQNIHASFFNRPTTGSLQIVPGGDQIGVYSIPVNQIIGNSHTFNNVQLKADGTSSVVQMNFTDNTGCIDAATGPTVPPCSTPPPPCTIAVDFLGNPGACNDNGTPNDPSDDFFTQNIHASFFNRPTTGSLQIVPGGDQIGVYSIPVNQIIGNSHTFNNVQLKADGTSSVVQMNFTDNTGCIDSDTGPAVQPCSGSSVCEVIGFSFANISSCHDNATPSNASDDFFKVDIDMLYSNSEAGRTLRLDGADVVNFVLASASVGTNITHTFSGVKLKATGQITNFIGQIGTLTPGFVESCSIPGTGPAVNSCANASCAITAANIVNIESCNDNGTPSNPDDDFYVADILVTFENPPSTGSLVVSGADLVNGDVAFSVANILAVGSPFPISNVKFRANGSLTAITAKFTAIPACSAIGNSPGVDPCSFPAPVLTCPLSMVFTCASEVPPVNLSSLSETHTCPGNVTIMLIDESTVSQTCANRFNLQRTFQATDACGQTSTCVQQIIVVDQTIPVTFCPLPVTVSCLSLVPPSNFSGGTLSDNCGGTVTVAHVGDVLASQTCANKLSITRTYRGTDLCGNTSTCSQIITVNDLTPPTSTCPANVSVSCANQVPAANTASVAASDNCSGATPTVVFIGDVISNQTCANRFTITRQYRSTDACNNTNTCSQTITVNDQTGPSLICPAVQTVSCAEQVPAPNPALVTGLSDNCGGSATASFFSNTISNQTCANRFTVTRQYRATDACGNTGSCTQVITVNDQTPPVFTSVPANTTVDCYIVPGVGIATASDNCSGGATVTFLGEVKTPGVCPIFYTLTRTWRAIDACGNSATAVQVVTVTDTNAPQFLVLPKDQVVECGPDNVAQYLTFLDNLGGLVAEDCAQITYTFDDSPIQNNSYDCGHTFRKNMRFFAIDECGNVSFQDASFTVVDLTPPVFSTPPQNVELECDATDDGGESAFYDWLDNNAGIVAEDACGEVTLERLLLDETHGCGNTWKRTVEFRAKDQCDNQAIIKATFAVVDHTPPTITCLPNDNVYLPCLEDVPAADPGSLSATDCSGVITTLKETWTNGTGCPNWPMTIAYRYAATDGCGNQAVCERAYYVKEASVPTLICPDTIKLACVNDIPAPNQLFAYIKTILQGNCAGGFTSINILADSGLPQAGATHRTYTIRAKNHCGLLTSSCTVTFLATGSCKQLCTASQATWGDPNGTIGGMNTKDVLEQLLQQYGPLNVGGGNHTLTAPTVDCVQELLFGNGTCTMLPAGHFSCPLPADMANADGSLNNQLAANAMGLQLNIWYNKTFNDRDFGVQDLNSLPDCLVDFPLLKELAQHSTVQDLMNLTNGYLQNLQGYYSPDLAAYLNVALDNLNFFRENCAPNAPCEKPGVSVQIRSGAAGTQTPMRMFPNPANRMATLEFWSDQPGSATLAISDMRGTNVSRTVETTRGLNSLNIALENLAVGVYSLTLQNGARLETLRLVKVGE